MCRWPSRVLPTARRTTRRRQFRCRRRRPRTMGRSVASTSSPAATSLDPRRRVRTRLPGRRPPSGRTSCPLSVVPTSLNAPAAGQRGFVEVTPDAADCDWVALSGASWVTLGPRLAFDSTDAFFGSVLAYRPVGYWIPYSGGTFAPAITDD